MKLIVALASLMLVAVIQCDLTIEDKEWEQFKETFAKEYDDEEDLVHRKIFETNKKLIKDHNAGNSSYKMGVNFFADLSKDQLNYQFGLQQNFQLAPNPDEANEFLFNILEKDVPVPEELDWRKVPGRVSDVKDQRPCGYCWAFATTGLLEGQEVNYAMPPRVMANRITAIGLSEQRLVDCEPTHERCSGFRVDSALEVVSKLGGLPADNEFPYEGPSKRYCPKWAIEPIIVNKGFANVEFSPDKLKVLVAKYGPVVSYLFANNTFTHYQTGIYMGEECDQEIASNHAVLIVGYGTSEDGEDYWIVKNSWGAKWGDNGYVLMARNQKCNLGMNATIATF